MRTLFLMILLSGVSFSTFAQELAAGIKGGLNFPGTTSIGFDPDAVSNSSSSGFHGGAFFRLRLAKVAIQPEILFNRQKFDFTIEDPAIPGNEIDIEQFTSYVTVPVQLKYYIVSGLNVQVGPQFGFLMNAEQVDNSLGADTSTSIESFLKGVDLGVNGGIGVDLPLGLQISARYVLGITDILDVTLTDGSGNVINDATRNSMIQVSVGYSFVDLGR